jgi:hypothetical protein
MSGVWAAGQTKVPVDLTQPSSAQLAPARSTPQALPDAPGLKQRPVQTPEEKEAARIAALGKVNGVIYDQPSVKDQFLDYLRDSYGEPAFVRSTVRALYNQAQDGPSGWGQDFPGFMQRFGSNAAITAINGNVRFGMELAFHEDLRYIPCHGCSKKRKLENALLSEVTARHDVDGHRFFTLTPAIADFLRPHHRPLPVVPRIQPFRRRGGHPHRRRHPRRPAPLHRIRMGTPPQGPQDRRYRAPAYPAQRAYPAATSKGNGYTGQQKTPHLRSPSRAINEPRKLVRPDHQTDRASRDRSHHVVAIHLAPFVAAWRGLQVIGAIVYGFSAAPIFLLHLRALLPLAVLHVLMVIVTGGRMVVRTLVMVVLREHRSAEQYYG